MVHLLGASRCHRLGTARLERSCVGGRRRPRRADACLAPRDCYQVARRSGRSLPAGDRVREEVDVAFGGREPRGVGHVPHITSPNASR